MDKNATYGLIITYNDGSHDLFKFPSQADKSKVGHLVAKLLGSSVLCLQLEDRLLVVPTANIRNAEIYPTPDELPELVIRDVQRVNNLP